MNEKTDSKEIFFATVSILGQAPSGCNDAAVAKQKWL
jgi:hypothetical protein